MKIAIHNNKGFGERWIAYCQEKKISYKIVNCYDNDIIEQLADCDALMWHFYHASPKDFLFAKQLLYSVQMSGKKVFPDFNTMWHFDDKLGQKYLLESIKAAFVPTYAFYDKTEAIRWAENTIYPKVFKLRGGAGSTNVRLINKQSEATKLIKQSFLNGHKSDSIVSFTDAFNRFRKNRIGLLDLIKNGIQHIIPTEFSKVYGKQKGYVLFQDFIPNNNCDIRIIVIEEKAFGIKRLVRENDFRASGSGNIVYSKSELDETCVRMSFELNSKLKTQCIAIDYIFDGCHPFIVEISYGFMAHVYDPCEGYWDKDMVWHEGYFNPYEWMIENLIGEIK
jgi:glutathione synthase/RimK-type ligase-like ATP-grasp enzyme